MKRLFEIDEDGNKIIKIWCVNDSFDFDRDYNRLVSDAFDTFKIPEDQHDDINIVLLPMLKEQ